MFRRVVIFRRCFSTSVEPRVVINNTDYLRDSYTNVTPKILRHINKNLYYKKEHPLSFITQRIVQYFYDSFKGRTGNPIFSVFDQLNPVVTTKQNFDSLLVPSDHPSRSKNDCYYINNSLLLRSHMTAHQSELIQMGLNNFLMVGDVYRRDAIDATHYPVFHQLDVARLLTPEELFIAADDGQSSLKIMEDEPEKKVRTEEKQEVFTLEASKLAEKELKNTLEGLVKMLFGEKVIFKWVDAYFPFTHPSWEIEVNLSGKWIEVLGCGIMEYKILQQAGCNHRIGWAFGLGLERLAMILYDIPDIRAFWSKDSGFWYQFAGKTATDKIRYKPVSQHPVCSQDMSFWIPETFIENDFYEIVRDIGSEMVEQIHLIDVFRNPKTGLTSHCYRIMYRHLEKALTNEEVNKVHLLIAQRAAEELKIKLRM